MTTAQSQRTWRETLYVPPHAKDWVLNVVATRINRYDGYRAFLTRTALAIGIAAVFGWYLSSPEANPWAFLAGIAVAASLLQGVLEIAGERHTRRHTLSRSWGHRVFGDARWRRSYLINITGLLGFVACVLNILAVTFLLPAESGLVKVVALLLAMLYINSGLGAVLIDAPFYNREGGTLGWRLLCRARPFIGIGLGLVVAVAQVVLFQLLPGPAPSGQAAAGPWSPLSPPWPAETESLVLVALVSLLPIALSLRVLENERVLSAAHDMMVGETVHELRETSRWVLRKLNERIDGVEEKIEAGASLDDISEAVRSLRATEKRLIGDVTAGSAPAVVPAQEILRSAADELRRRNPEIGGVSRTVLVQAIHAEDHRIAETILECLCRHLKSRLGNFTVVLGDQMNNEVDEYVRLYLTVANANLTTPDSRRHEQIVEHVNKNELVSLKDVHGDRNAYAHKVEVSVDEDETIRKLAVKVSWVMRKVWL
ncbi:hypothetical protein [Streptomonospora salina]|uniref:Uncharacterized protein n=1 Tax=Streptomonospora salina TaxID=104205 RepID=A0A841ENC3_9ACTN|nr:hypothetical protein [Streptomonospora salina]MBB6000921.1 hypothetical protein [Streptomonospora salina]